MASSSGDLGVTPEEVERISKALKDEKFRQLFFEYAQEISDPENKKKYEEEITQLERNRGTDVVFVNPEPGYVIKTNVDGEQKAFINVCKSDKVAQPTAKEVRRDNGQVGTQWLLPHSLAPGRNDLDKNGKKCMVYDCVFHPDCFKNGEKDRRFFKLMDDTAFDSIQSNFGVSLDRANVKKLTKLKFKGQPRPTVIRTKNKSGPTGETDALKDLNVDYPYKDLNKENDTKGKPPAKSSIKISGNRMQSNKKDLSGPVEPKYSIIHRGHFDLQHFTNAPDSMPTTRPQELIIKIQLPLLKSIATVQLDVFEKRIILECQKPASYKLDLSLPYPVDEEKGNAKFDKSKSCLTISLPVLPPEIPKLPSFAPEPQSAPLIEEISQTTEVEEEHEEGLPKPSEEASEVVVASRTEETSQRTKGVDDVDDKRRNKNDCQDSDRREDTQEHSSGQVGGEDASNQDQKTSVSAEMATDDEECPSFSFRQDETTVSFILHVANVDPINLQKRLSGDNLTVSLKFRSLTNITGESVSVPYSLYVVFETQCQIQDMEVDVQTTEAVLLLHKAATSQGEWSGFKAGSSLQDLEDKLFLTEENVHEHLSTMTRKRKGKQQPQSAQDGMDCGVVEASEDKLVIELEPRVNGEAPVQEELSDVALGTVTDTVVDAVIGELCETAASLKLDLRQDELSARSDTSSPSTPCSPYGLKSVLKDGNQCPRKQRSVSFSEEVVVETMVSSSPRKAKGKNKRHQPPRRRRFITKLQDKSQNQGTWSDSEIHYRRRSNGREEEEEDEEEFQEEVVFPDWVSLDRQTSSDSSGGESAAPAADFNKKKKPKANKRQRKKMNAAKRAVALDENPGGMKDAWFEPRYPLRATSSEGSLATAGNYTGSVPKDRTKNPTRFDKTSEHHDNNQVKSKVEPEHQQDVQDQTEQKDVQDKTEQEDVQHKTSDKHEDEKIPLENQDHRTHSAVAFSNEIMFELDE